MQRDLKSENILLSKTGADNSMRAKAGDLGTARSSSMATFADTQIGTKSCMAPELLFAGLDALSYDPKLVDVYGLGMLTERHAISDHSRVLSVLALLEKQGFC